MTDKELLVLAAKAAGYPIHSDAWAISMGGGEVTLYMGNNGPKWNPLTDDGDALRLAVKCGIDVGFVGGFQFGKVIGAVTMDHTYEEINEIDPYAATRRAIVRAAAAESV